ncbi:hypothetical protein [Bradyrhizobium sp.]|uniref:hypothetical protein n=1 Tax=Bradyrhizobium sp. TaxID=376 RepID=UPI0025C148CF|nr:hypothetical protein [Bradyrhizobium sp.]
MSKLTDFVGLFAIAPISERPQLVGGRNPPNSFDAILFAPGFALVSDFVRGLGSSGADAK